MVTLCNYCWVPIYCKFHLNKIVHFYFHSYSKLAFQRRQPCGCPFTVIVLFPRIGYSALYSAVGDYAACVALRPSTLTPPQMSLPRSDYDPRRVCLNPFPFLDKLNLGKHRRTFGVYLAGGLVSPFPCFNSHPNQSPILSSRSESGHSSTPQSSPHTHIHHSTSRTTRRPCMSHSQIGSRVSARFSVS